MTVKKVEFNSVGVKLVGNLYLPADFDESKSYKTIVMTPPAHQIKDQTPACYGPKFAEKGFIFFAFDYNSMGESDSYSDGVRNDQHAFRKQENLRDAISFLRSHPFVDRDKFYGIGVCGGGNIMSSVLITDLRIKAFASISAMMATDALFFSDKDMYSAIVSGGNDARQGMFESGEPVNIDLFGYDDPEYKEKNPEAAGAQLEGFDYYGTARAGTATYPLFSNKVLANINESVMINIGEAYADRMVQPYLAVVGDNADTAFSTDGFYEKVTAEKEYYKVPNCSHVDLYDKDEPVTLATNKIAEFFDKH